MLAEGTATGVAAVHGKIAMHGTRKQDGMRTGTLVGTRRTLVRVNETQGLARPGMAC